MSRLKRALNEYEERIERGLRVRRILPNNTVNLRYLVLEHQKATPSYNDSARRFEKLLERRRAPVRALANGTVIRVARDSGYGMFVVVFDESGSSQDYAQLSAQNVLVGERLQPRETP